MNLILSVLSTAGTLIAVQSGLRLFTTFASMFTIKALGQGFVNGIKGMGSKLVAGAAVTGSIVGKGFGKLFSKSGALVSAGKWALSPFRAGYDKMLVVIKSVPPGGRLAKLFTLLKTPSFWGYSALAVTATVIGVSLFKWAHSVNDPAQGIIKYLAHAGKVSEKEAKSAFDTALNDFGDGKFENFPHLLQLAMLSDPKFQKRYDASSDTIRIDNESGINASDFLSSNDGELNDTEAFLKQASSKDEGWFWTQKETNVVVLSGASNAASSPFLASNNKDVSLASAYYVASMMFGARMVDALTAAGVIKDEVASMNLHELFSSYARESFVFDSYGNVDIEATTVMLAAKMVPQVFLCIKASGIGDVNRYIEINQSVVDVRNEISTSRIVTSTGVALMVNALMDAMVLDGLAVILELAERAEMEFGNIQIVHTNGSKAVESVHTTARRVIDSARLAGMSWLNLTYTMYTNVLALNPLEMLQAVRYVRENLNESEIEHASPFFRKDLEALEAFDESINF